MANLVESLAQSVTSMGVKASYGEAIVLGGVEMVPVALVVYGFGGGSDATAGGGGGGPDGVRFRPNPVALVGVFVPFAVAASWAIVGSAILGRSRR